MHKKVTFLLTETFHMFNYNLKVEFYLYIITTDYLVKKIFIKLIEVNCMYNYMLNKTNNISSQEAIELLKNLVCIKSDFFHEEKIMKFTYEWLKNNNLNIEFHNYEDKKITGFKGINLIGSLEGSKQGPVILINCHLDTVNECSGWTKHPYNPVIENGRLYGLGALDMKSGCAAALMALKKFNETIKEFKGKIIYSFVSDEEGPYGLGTSFSIKDKLYKDADIAIILEPSSGFLFTQKQSICLGARGGYQYKIKLYGKSSHAATPQNGINAIEDASKLIVELSKLPAAYDEKLGNSSICITDIKSKGNGCSVPDYAEIEIFKHIVMGENKQSIIEEIKLAAINANIKSKYEIVFREDPLDGSGGFMPYTVDEKNKYIKEFYDCVEDITGKSPEINYFSSIGDFNTISEKLNIPVIVYGPSGSNFHSYDEYVEIDTFLEVSEVLYGYLVKKLT
ncbi:MAG: peptidase [Bacillota bacterium]|nr:peptidase [Bacillota bacterium]